MAASKITEVCEEAFKDFEETDVAIHDFVRALDTFIKIWDKTGLMLKRSQISSNKLLIMLDAIATVTKEETV